MARSSTTFEKGREDTGNHTPEAEKKRADTFKVNKLIKGDINSYIRNLLLSPKDRHKDPFYQEYLQKATTEALKEPNSPIGLQIFRELMQEGVINALDAETEKYLNKDISFFRYRLQERLFTKQKDVFNDNTSRKILEMCSRRAGKTENNADLLLKYACEPNTPVLYLNLTFENAVSQIFQIILDEAKRVD